IKYSSVEINENSMRSNNILDKDFNRRFENQSISTESIKLITANSYLYAGRCYYILRNYHKALEMATKSVSIRKDIIEAGYDKAKYNCMLGNVDQAINDLNIIISQDKYVSLKVVNDLDFISHKKIITYLKNLKDETKSKLVLKINEVNNLNYRDEIIDKKLSEINQLYHKDTFIDMQNALEIITNKEKYLLKNSIIKADGGYVF